DQCRIEKFDGSFLLETKAVPNASAGIDEKSDGQRQVGFGAEIGNRLRPAVFKDLEMLLLEIRYELALLICDRKEHIYQVDINGYRLLAGVLWCRSLPCQCHCGHCL